MKIKSMITMIFIMVSAIVYSQNSILENINLQNIQPEGWLKTMLINQRDNFTGYLDTISQPFIHGGWSKDPFLRTENGKTFVHWVPYEQTAYWYDGMARCGYLLNDSFLKNKAHAAIYGSIKHASPEGIIESILSAGDRRRWPHAVYFRAMMAAYESTQDPQVLNALDRHFKNDTVPMLGRDFCNLETVAWLYQTTGDKYFYDKAMDMYDLYKKHTSVYDDVIGDFNSSNKQEMHAVTYHEMLKLPIILYMLTGDKTHLNTALNGFRKLDEFHMLPDGVASSEECLSEKGPLNTHETCNVVDYMWTCTYMLKSTGEVEWADRIERALFNAGLGSITKTFDTHQYASAPNQVVCTSHSSHVLAYDASRMAYRQVHEPHCCTGNVNRMLPIYVGSQWLKGEDDRLIKAMYGPGRVTHNVGKKRVVLEEKSVYPYSDTIQIDVIQGEASFPLFLRIPQWTSDAVININGDERKNIPSGQFYTLYRNFKKGDKIKIYLPKKAQFRQWSAQAMIVDYGPLLFALPVKSQIEKENIQSNPKQKSTMGYEMNPASDWNYILGVDGKDQTQLKVVKSEITHIDNPWMQYPQPIQIKVPAYKDPSWKLIYQQVTTKSGEVILSPTTPPLQPRGSMMFISWKLQPEVISLVPYGSTELRISMFPFWKARKIAPEVLAADTN